MEKDRLFKLKSLLHCTVLKIAYLPNQRFCELNSFSQNNLTHKIFQLLNFITWII